MGLAVPSARVGTALKQENDMSQEKPHDDDQKTIHQIQTLATAGGVLNKCLDYAYQLGRIRGRLEGVEKAVAKLASA